MKGLKLAVAIFALGTIAISPKAEAKTLSNSQQTLISQVTPQSPGLKKDTNNSTSVLFERGFKRIEKADYQGAIQDFNEILKLDPKSAYAYVGRGLAYLSLEKYQSAKTDFDKGLEITPDIAYAYYFRGLTSYLLKDKPSAIADLQKAGELFKKDGNQDFAQKVNSAIKKIEES
jgi:tetratricopeptide (TPR) repeat protein